MTAIDVTLCAFPDVTGDHAVSRAALGGLCDATGCPPQLDAEPRGAHWTDALFAAWLDWRADLTVTTTRWEAGHLGAHIRRCYAQLESSASTALFGQAMAVFGLYSARESIVPVIGDFDERQQDGTVRARTLDDIRRDLAGGEAQAILVGELAVWSAHAMGGDEADVFAAWSQRTGVALSVYCDSWDDKHPLDTVRVLRRCGATRAILMVEGLVPGGVQRARLADVQAFVAACRA